MKNFMRELSDKGANKKFSGNIVDVLHGTIYAGAIEISGGRIEKIVRGNKDCEVFIIPGLVDSHIHIESSMLVPSEFARLAVRHGTVAAVADPHEIANVLGIKGIKYMVEEGRKVPFKFYFGAPSCVPATPFETSGAAITADDMEALMRDADIHCLGEVMNFPAVIHNDPEIMRKIEIAKRYKKPIDGHAPQLRGGALDIYLRAGIDTDHEVANYEEGREKLQKGMKLLIREGSTAQNLDELAPLINEFPDLCMLCSDDKHPGDLVNGHINEMVGRLLHKGLDIITVLKCAALNPARHYGLDMGFLQEGDSADFVIIDNLKDFNILCTVIGGQALSFKDRCFIERLPIKIINNFNVSHKTPEDFRVYAKDGLIRLIEATDGQILTKASLVKPKVEAGMIVSDTQRDILKIAVVNRYSDAAPAVGFIKNFGLKAGAIASSVAHDSHNIIAVGVEDADIALAVNAIINQKGGLAIGNNNRVEILPLPVAGLMSDRDGFFVAGQCHKLNKMVEELGCRLAAPFMTLSFMALLVMPELKIGDKGLFDVNAFQHVPLTTATIVGGCKPKLA